MVETLPAFFLSSEMRKKEQQQNIENFRVKISDTFV